MTTRIFSKLAFITASFAIATVAMAVDSPPLTLNKAIALAQQLDPWLQGNKFQQQAVENMSVAANTLPDPKASITIANLPTDSFQFDQEGMTQFKIGVSQMFPRGDSLAIKQQQLQQLAQQFPYQRQNRQAMLAVEVGTIWLNAYLAQQSIALIEQDYPLFQQLSDVVQANYASTVGKSRQQDIVRAELELQRLDDRITLLKQQQMSYQQQLTQWLSRYQTVAVEYSFNAFSDFRLATTLPDIELQQADLIEHAEQYSTEQLVDVFAHHPAVLAIEQQVKAADKSIELAKQSYQPEWGVSASYGYRNNAENGTSRADLLSVGVSFEIPLFTENKQDKQVEAAIHTKSAVTINKVLKIRELMAKFASKRADYQQLIERHQRFEQQILPQSHLQAEAALTAYTNDDGDFAEVVRARIAELNSKIDALAIKVNLQKTKLSLNYLTVTANNSDQ
jgi:outer membrane protein TolC